MTNVANSLVRIFSYCVIWEPLARIRDHSLEMYSSFHAVSIVIFCILWLRLLSVIPVLSWWEKLVITDDLLYGMYKLRFMHSLLLFSPFLDPRQCPFFSNEWIFQSPCQISTFRKYELIRYWINHNTLKILHIRY